MVRAPSPSLKPFSRLIKLLWPRRSMATGRLRQHPNRPRAAHARGRRIDRGNLRSITVPAPPLLPGPRCPATAARSAPIGRRRAGLLGGVVSWSARPRRGPPGAWLRALVDAASHLTFPGAGRGLRVERGLRRMEQPAGLGKKFIDPFLISGTHGFLRWGRLNGWGGR